MKKFPKIKIDIFKNLKTENIEFYFIYFIYVHKKLLKRKKGSIPIISIVPKSGNIVWYRRIHSKINLAITVIPIAVRRRVKYEQKSRHRYHVYANLLDKIDEQDVTANIRPLSLSLSLLPSVSYIATSEYTSAISTRSRHSCYSLPFVSIWRSV